MVLNSRTLSSLIRWYHIDSSKIRRTFVWKLKYWFNTGRRSSCSSWIWNWLMQQLRYLNYSWVATQYLCCASWRLQPWGILVCVRYTGSDILGIQAPVTGWLDCVSDSHDDANSCFVNQVQLRSEVLATQQKYLATGICQQCLWSASPETSVFSSTCLWQEGFLVFLLNPMDLPSINLPFVMLYCFVWDSHQTKKHLSSMP